ncbi:MAG: MMPL family transporter, partial [Acidiferrobacterales bacterium]|nr:MMPL family transporter [Acidiferrobacterales bacterium]
FQQQQEIQSRQLEVQQHAASIDEELEDLDDFNDFEDDFFDDFENEFADDSPPVSNLTVSSYWFNEDGLAKIKAIQSSLEALPETGKVLSLASSMSIFDNLKDAKPMDNFDLAFMHSVLSQENKDTLFTPYMSEDGNQLHINIRVFESHQGLDRNALINNVRQMLINDHGLEDKQINVSGMLVLYNNMLNSLFSSQIMTLGTVFLVIFLMFIVLFRNIKLALITIIPNLFSAAVVLGVMGIFKIPLDLMTITIAAISVGIAVDNSIHFVHRFKDEFLRHGNYSNSIKTAIDNVGQAMFYTTLVVASGFLIMVFSNFVPTMYFGLLTALAMATALIANLIMLPLLIAKIKPL